jgi:cell division transport system ATP-binding protein
MVHLFHVSKYYNQRPAIRDVTLTIEKGEFVLLMGPSGAGKTTLLKLLSCAIFPDEGQILIQGRNVARLKPSAVPLVRRSMGMVFQDFKLLPKKSVYENVALPLVVQGLSMVETRRRVLEALKAVGVEHRKESCPTMLSAGEQQRVCIARAIVSAPSILLADEPTGNLDPALACEIVELLKAIHARGTTVLVATHNHQIVEQVGRRVVKLEQGKIISDEGQGR